MARKTILLCGHPNPLGCPNHGDIAREVSRAKGGCLWVRLRKWPSGKDRTRWPIEFELTDKGHAVAREQTNV